MIKNNRQELIWVFIASTLILVFSSLPTWVGYQAQTEDLRFRGSYFDTQDYAVHISMMEAGRHRELGYQFRFTTEAHTPAYLRLFYIALGHVTRLVNLQVETTFELSRWILGYFALFSLYYLMKRIFPDLLWIRTSFLLAVLGSGIGWLQLIFNWTPGPITPIDFWLIDSYVFFSLSLFPHFALVTAGMCIILNLWLIYLDAPNWKAVASICVTGCLVQLVNPIALATVDAALVGATLASCWGNKRFNWLDLLSLGVVAISQLPLLVYNFIVLNNDPIWSQFTIQNKTLSPPLIYYLLGVALFLPFAVIGVIDLARSKSKGSAAAFFWVVSALILAYAPVMIQRRFTQNITIPLAILAVHGLIRIFNMESIRGPILERRREALVVMFVLIASFSTIQLSLGRSVYAQTHPEDLYYPSSLDKAIAWLQQNAEYNDFVLADENTSLILAQRAGMRAYFGHEMETLYYEEKGENVRDFFLRGKDKITMPSVQWVIYGPYERKINSDFQPPENLDLVYDSPELKIYRVR